MDNTPDHGEESHIKAREDAMIRHIVLVRFAPTTDDAERDGIFADLATLMKIVPGTLAFAAGPNISSEGRSGGFTHAFTFDFNSESARDAYLEHPTHKAAGARLRVGADGGRDGLLIIDIRTDG